MAANTGHARSATLTVAGKTFTVNQAGTCTYTVSPLSIVVNQTGDGGTLNVTTATGCTWTTTSSVSWITINSPSGTGSGSSFWTASSNAGGTPRTGSISIAGKTVTVTQNGPPGRPAPPANVRVIR